MKFAILAGLAGVVLPLAVWAKGLGDVVTPSSSVPLEEKIPDIGSRAGENQFFTFNIENDMFGGNSDRHYTNGFRLSYFDVRNKPPAFTDALDRLLPMFDIGEDTGVVYSVGQNLYTPDDIKDPYQRAGGRPWAGFLYTSVGLATLSGNHVDELEATLGVVGPLAMGKEVQTLVHGMVSADKPKGWHNQLSNEPGAILSWQRRWPEFLYLEKGGFYLSGEPNLGATAGNIYTYANTGFNLRFGPASSRWQDTPVRVRPAMPGTGFYAPTPHHEFFSWYLFAGADGRAVARNIFLDGNTFADSAHVNKKILVGDLNAGAAVTLGRVRLSYTNVYRTREYNGQDKGDVFGALTLGYRF